MQIDTDTDNPYRDPLTVMERVFLAAMVLASIGLVCGAGGWMYAKFIA